jgi:hypothetical protein
MVPVSPGSVLEGLGRVRKVAEVSERFRNTLEGSGRFPPRAAPLPMGLAFGGKAAQVGWPNSCWRRTRSPPQVGKKGGMPPI